MRNEKFILRPFETPAVTWSHEEVVPSNITIAMTYHGALALGAFSSDGVMLGMVFSFLSPAHVPGANKGLSHHSHMAAVLPDYRGQGVGEALKREQATRLLAQGINLVTWTYDPLEAKNANLNINKLGCICRTYIENCYGEMRDSLNVGLPSDRLEVEWWLGERRAKGEERKAKGEERASRSSPDSIAIAIPLDFQALKKQDFELAKNIRLKTRAQFQAAFASGYVITQFERQTDRGVYNLMQISA